MMFSYFMAFLQANKIKSSIICLSIAVYFALVVISATLHSSIPEIARLPLKTIGVQTIVQKTGEIPGQMVGAIFPHSNAPISVSQFNHLKELPFVEDADIGLFFWYFDRIFFKAVLGLNQEKGIVSSILQKNIAQGEFDLGQGKILLTDGFSTKHKLTTGETVALGERNYLITGILKANISGNIIPADIYMGKADALAVVRDSEEMQKIYKFGNGDFGNVVLLKGDPGWQGDKESKIKELDQQLLVFSEKTFTTEIVNQLGLISAAGRLLFIVLGVILILVFALLTSYTIKSRQGEIAILRMLGWKLADLKKQFIRENLLYLGISIFTGCLLSLGGLYFLAQQTITMELPWDISARPHFLPEENNIERMISANMPVHFDAGLFLSVSAGFLLVFLAVNFLSFSKIKRIKPHELLK